MHARRAVCSAVCFALPPACAFACSIPFCLARVRGMHPRVDRVMDRMATWMGATVPTDPHKGSKQPAPRTFLRGLKVTRYVKPNDPEAAAEGGYIEPSECVAGLLRRNCSKLIAAAFFRCHASLLLHVSCISKAWPGPCHTRHTESAWLCCWLLLCCRLLCHMLLRV